MKRMMMIAGLAAALCAGGWMSAERQPEGMEGGMPDMAQMMEMMKQASQPDDPHHKYLEKMAGDWNITAKFTMMPGSPPEVSKGTCKSELVLGGRQLMGTIDLDMTFMGEKMPMKGISMMGYDKTTNEFQSTWVSSWETGQMYQSGTLEDGAIVIEGTTKNMMGEYTVKNVIKFVDGGYDMEFWEKGDMTGNEMMNTGVIEYRRAGKQIGG